MTVLSAPKLELLAQAKDPKQGIIDAIGDLSGVDVLSDLVLVGTYIRNEKTAGGIIRPKENIAEDEHQGKCGLVLKTGPLAYLDGEDDPGDNARIHSWVVYTIGNVWKLQINGVPCALVPYEKLRMRVREPSGVF